MNFELDEDTILLRDSVRDLGKQKADQVGAWDEARALPEGWLAELAGQGLLAMRIGEADGGAGLSTLAALSVIEELAAFDTATAFATAVHNLWALAQAGEQAAALAAEGVVLGFATGDIEVVQIGESFALTGTASQAFLPTTAQAWVVAAEFDGASQAFLVRASEDVSGSARRTLGMRAADLGALEFRGAAATSLGPVDTAASTDGSLAMGFIAAGISRAALEEGRSYALERKQFGKPIAAFQAIQWKVADLATRLEAAQLMLSVAAGRTDEGRRAAAARAVTVAVEAATAGTHDMLQIHGGYGYTHEFAIERLYRDARAVSLVAGIRQELRDVAAEAIVRRFGDTN